MHKSIKKYLRFGGETFALAVLIACCISGSPVAAEIGPFHLGIGFSSRAFANVPKEDIRIAVKVLSEKVARKVVGSAESRVYDSSEDFERDLKAKKLDVMALTPEEFIHLRNRVPLEAAMVTVAQKNLQVDLLLLVRKDSGLNSMADLKKKSISLPALMSQLGSTYHTWLETLVMKEGGDSLETHFSSVKDARNGSQAVMAVFFRSAAAGVASSQAFEVTAELNPQVARDLKVIARIGGLAGGVIALRQDLPEDRKQKVRQALKTLHEDQEGRQMFMLFQLNRLTPFRPEYLKGTESLYAAHRNLKARMARK
ncbi:MAG: PhnD/SsuA/transferrin family substrate-binding protein [Desulfuromonadales bacterium]|nr:PhnD/SsuA/transferrin family substrate-binding protein [Desulfuromonadales bacterium]